MDLTRGPFAEVACIFKCKIYAHDTRELVSSSNMFSSVFGPKTEGDEKSKRLVWSKNAGDEKSERLIWPPGFSKLNS